MIVVFSLCEGRAQFSDDRVDNLLWGSRVEATSNVATLPVVDSNENLPRVTLSDVCADGTDPQS